MAQETAVEWLEMIVKSMLDNGGDFEELMALMDHIEKAKSMEKEQMINFADEYGFHICGYDNDRAEQYYNETFKK